MANGNTEGPRADLLGSITPDRELIGPDSQLHTLAELAHNVGTPWAVLAISSYEAAKIPRQRGKAMGDMAKAMGRYAATRNGIEIDNGLAGLYSNVYDRVSRAVANLEVQPDPDFAYAIYTEVIPELLGINGLSKNFLNEAGNNSISQVVACAMNLMRGQEVRDAGGKVSILSQMCAQYDSGSSHSEESFSRGLLRHVSEDKVRQVAAPMQRVVQALTRFGVPVEVITPQVTADPKLLLAMVPATVWSYVDRRASADMLTSLQQHEAEVPEVFARALGADQNPHLTYRSPSYSELQVNGGMDTTSMTLYYAGIFGNAYNRFNQWRHSRRGLDEDPPCDINWMNLTPADVGKFLDLAFDRDMIQQICDNPERGTNGIGNDDGFPGYANVGNSGRHRGIL